METICNRPAAMEIVNDHEYELAGQLASKNSMTFTQFYVNFYVIFFMTYSEKLTVFKHEVYL